MQVKDDFAFRDEPATPAEMAARAQRICSMVGWPNRCFVGDSPLLECAGRCLDAESTPLSATELPSSQPSG